MTTRAVTRSRRGDPGRNRLGIAMALALLIALLSACSDGAEDSGEAEQTDAETEEPAPETTEVPVEVEPIEGPTLDGSVDTLVPTPESVEQHDSDFGIRPDTVIVVPEDLEEAGDAAELLRDVLGPATGADLPISTEPDGHTAIRMVRSEDEAEPGSYGLEVDETEISLEAADHEGFIWAAQTLRQLAHPRIESAEPAEETFVIPGVTIRDRPRYEWRAAMLDIVRHWFGPDDVKAYIDQISLYKINRLHLHLSDDQGWRIEIRSHPELTEIGSNNEVGGGPGGFLTQDDYRDLVEHAESRGVTIVPEIDMPGHTNAALLADPDLDCSGEPIEPYTDTQVGFSTLCVTDEYVYDWIDDVIGELAELTPGDWIHMGGDESDSTPQAEYEAFVTRALDIVRSHDKTPIGWDEIGEADLGGDAVVQHWGHTNDPTLHAAEKGASVIMSPHAATYLDMKHVEGASGNSWAGIIDARTAWEWDPDTRIEGLDPEVVMGVEAPLWTELISDYETIQQRTLPRLPAIADLAWSVDEGRAWDDVAGRLAHHTARWDQLGWAWTDDPSVPDP